MSIACDFCKELADRHEEKVFVAAPSGLAHICEVCVKDCADTVAAEKAKQ